MSRLPRFDIYIRRPGSRWRRISNFAPKYAADYLKGVYREAAIPIKVLPVRHGGAIL